MVSVYGGFELIASLFVFGLAIVLLTVADNLLGELARPQFFRDVIAHFSSPFHHTHYITAHFI
jgi:hypothetical protein